MRIIGTYPKFKKFIGKTEISVKLDDAIKVYLDQGGVIKVENKKPVKFLYPTKSKLKQELEENQKKEKYIEDQIKIWGNEMTKLNTNGMIVNVMRVANPTYWQHLAQMASSAEYRKSFETVDPPMELMNTNRYKKVIEMFVKNPEYRERLVEARTSILGKMRDSIKETAYKSDEFKRQTIDARVKKLYEEKSVHSKKAEAVKIMLDNSGQFF